MTSHTRFSGRSAGPDGHGGRVSPSLLEDLIERHRVGQLPRLLRLWRYYRNPLGPGARGEPAQVEGLPGRLRGGAEGNATPAAGPGSVSGGGASGGGVCGGERERVIENDIGWRVETLVDFMFGRAFTITSTAADPGRAEVLTALLRAAIDHAGGAPWFQSLGLLGSVYGHVDVLVRPAGSRTASRRGSDDPAALARRVSLELVEPTRGIPLVDPGDYRRLDAYLIHTRQLTHEVVPGSLLTRVRARLSGDEAPVGGRRVIERTEVWTPGERAVYLREPGVRSPRRAAVREANRLGRVPVVHIQNLPMPLQWDGLSEVEPLIPLQNELNTRLSDRANRITFQCFKMYLGKSIGGFLDRPVGPGQMWSTDDPDASIQEFGGDAANPSETQHITEVREAMDKVSGVTPLASGVIRDKIGNLTSENALRVTMMGLLAKTSKKRVAYGNGIARLCELILHVADAYGLLPNTPGERGVRIDWPDPLPASESQQLLDARIKLELGVPRERVLAELGYGGCVQ